MTYDPKKVPQRMIEALQDYAKNGTPKGDFLTAVLHNNLILACAYADRTNYEVLAHVVGWCHNELPPTSWKTQEAVGNWLEAHTRCRKKYGFGKYDITNVLIALEQMEIEEQEDKKKDEENEGLG